MSSKYQIRNHQALHFITFSVIQWIPGLSRPLYKDIVIDSLKYCIQSKGLVLYAYVIMNDHIHLIGSAEDGFNLSDILRDFKKFTSKKILYEIENNPMESRKNWMLWLFKSAGKANSNNEQYQFWDQDNHPIELSTNYMMDQKLNYIHQNPVKAGLVTSAEFYPYSSAIIYAGGKGLIDVEFIE